MLSLLRSLQDQDLGHLRILGELWGIDLPAGGAAEVAPALARQMLDPFAAREQAEGLVPPARQALDFLLAQGGRYPLADLIRRYGDLRRMGPGRRDREKPWRNPVSGLEALWYRGLISIAFADAPAGPQEFAFIPQDLLALLPAPPPESAPPPGHAASRPAWERPAGTACIEDATTILAMLRRRSAGSLQLPESRARALSPFLIQPRSASMLLVLLREAGLVSGPPFRPAAEAARAFLEAAPGDALASLQMAWSDSSDWNDLAAVPYLQAPGGRWPNEPGRARRAVLDQLRRIPGGTWWDLQALVSALRESNPGFQRPAGDFDSWYLSDARTGAYLQGFGHWDEIEGELIRYLLTGPLHWLGAIDLGGESPEAVGCFRLSPLGSALLEGTPAAVPEPAAVATLAADGRITAPPGCPRTSRYQIARCARWIGRDDLGFHYRVTPESLHAAAEQGLRMDQVRTLLEAASGRPLPTPLGRALERFESRGVEARLGRPLVLRLKSARVLGELRANPAVARYLGELLGPATVSVQARDWEKLCLAAARLGLLIEPPDLDSTPEP